MFFCWVLLIRLVLFIHTAILLSFIISLNTFHLVLYYFTARDHNRRSLGTLISRLQMFGDKENGVQVGHRDWCNWTRSQYSESVFCLITAKWLLGCCSAFGQTARQTELGGLLGGWLELSSVSTHGQSKRESSAVSLSPLTKTYSSSGSSLSICRYIW